MLGLKTNDNSGAFRCYRTDTLRQLDFDQIQSRGYSVFEEILFRLQPVGARFAELPIVFVDREQGKSKINRQEAWTALRILTGIGLERFRGRPKSLNVEP
jgi:dolichol-phosphate mannosyltransferase